MASGKPLFLFAVLYIVAIKLTVAVILRQALALDRVLARRVGTSYRSPALPRLSDHLGLRWGSIYLGVIWAVWHLPQFFIPASDTYGQSFLIFAFRVVAISVTPAWLWNAAAKSLLPPMLLHSAVNNAKDIVPSASPVPNNAFGLSASPVASMTVPSLWVVALYLLTRIRGLEGAAW